MGALTQNSILASDDPTQATATAATTPGSARTIFRRLPCHPGSADLARPSVYLAQAQARAQTSPLLPLFSCGA